MPIFSKKVFSFNILIQESHCHTHFYQASVCKCFILGINPADFFYEMYTVWNCNKFVMFSWSHQNEFWFNIIFTCCNGMTNTYALLEYISMSTSIWLFMPWSHCRKSGPSLGRAQIKNFEQWKFRAWAVGSCLISIQIYVNLGEMCEAGPRRRLCPACAPYTRGMHAACPAPMRRTGGAQSWPTRIPRSRIVPTFKIAVYFLKLVN